MYVRRAAHLTFIYSGEYGMGTQANELSLGCDCLGTIHYMVRVSNYQRGKQTKRISLVPISAMMEMQSTSRTPSASMKKTLDSSGNIPISAQEVSFTQSGLVDL